MPRTEPQRIAFGRRALDELPARPTRYYVYDTRVPGLAVAVSPTGHKSYVFYRRIHGRPERVKIGRYPDLAPAVARKVAQEMIGEIARGGNPQADRRRARAGLTLGEAFEHFLETHSKPRKRTWVEDQRQYDRYLKPWKGRRLSQIRRGDVLALHAKIGRQHGRYAANRCLSLLSAVVNHAIDVMGFEGANPASRVPRFKELPRERFLDADELRRFFGALSEQLSDLWRDFFIVLLLTGARRANVLAMAWADVDLDRGLWRISADQAKGGEPLVVILADPVVEILRRRLDATEAEPFVFPSRSRTGHVMDPTLAWKRILRQAKLKDVRLHDLRRTLGSWQAATGASMPVIGKTLGHRSLQATAVYARLDLKPVRASVDTATKAMLAVIDDENAQDNNGE